MVLVANMSIGSTEVLLDSSFKSTPHSTTGCGPSPDSSLEELRYGKSSTWLDGYYLMYKVGLASCLNVVSHTSGGAAIGLLPFSPR